MKNSTGVWLDHATAKIIEIKNGKAIITTVQSPYKRHIRVPGLSIKKERSGHDFYYYPEYKLHHRKMHDLSSFYNDLSDKIKEYDQIVLFGPANAKKELYNFLKKNRNLRTKSISTESTGKMSEKQMAAFVKDYFSFNQTRKAV